MIEVKDLTKNFGSIEAISEVTFSVGKGEILGLLGPNGAGKTTTMRILSGIFPPTSGRAIVAGFDVSRDPMEIRKRIGYLPEQVPLYPELTVTEYLDFVGSIWKCGRKERGAAIKACGLEEVECALIGRLSRGYRQRVGIAQALIHNPDVLILDEPTVGLDPRQIREIRRLIKSFQGQKTVILSTHILPEVSMTCQKVVIIHQGKVVAEGTPEKLVKGIETGPQVELEIQGPQEEVRKTLAAIPGVGSVEITKEDAQAGSKFLVHLESAEARGEISRTIVQKNWNLLEMRLQELTLEDVFVKLVTKEEAE